MDVGAIIWAVGVGEGSSGVSVAIGDTGDTGDPCQAHTLVPGGENRNATLIATRAMANNFISKKGNTPLRLSKVIIRCLVAGSEAG